MKRDWPIAKPFLAYLDSDTNLTPMQGLITMKNFTKWFIEELGESAEDIAIHGADCGYRAITYTSDCVDIFDKFEDEIWDGLVEEAEQFGEHPCAMIINFGRKDMAASSFDQFKNLLVWWACEYVAQQIVDIADEANCSVVDAIAGGYADNLNGY